MDLKPITTVVNILYASHDIYIGRQFSYRHYGNPFILGTDGNRADVIKKFRFWLAGVAYTDREPKQRKWVLDHLEDLRGKVLGCHCKPKDCHGDVYVEVLDGLKGRQHI